MKGPPKDIFVMDEHGNFMVVRESLVMDPNSSLIPNRLLRQRSSSTASSRTLRAQSPSDTDDVVILEHQPPKIRPWRAIPERTNKKRSRDPEVDQHQPQSLAQLNRNVKARIFVELDDDDVEDDSGPPKNEEYRREELIDLDQQDDEILEQSVFREAERPRTESQPRPQSYARNNPLELPLVQIQSVHWKGVQIQAGSVLELHDRDFIQVKIIIQNLETDEIRLRGLILRRCTHMRGMFERKINELCYILEIDKSDPRPEMEQSMVDVSLCHLSRSRKGVFTNKTRQKDMYKHHSMINFSKKQTLDFIRENGDLYIRWKLLREWRNGQDRLNADKYPNRFKSCKIMRLKEDECSEGEATSPEELRTLWRGCTILGGSGTKSRGMKNRHDQQSRNTQGSRRPRNEEVFECHLCQNSFSHAEEVFSHHEKEHELLDDVRYRFQSIFSLDGPDEKVREVKSANHASVPKPKAQAYTYGDTYSGGGGSTRAAVEAGLDVIYAMDGNPDCIPTLKTNFPGAKIYCEWSNIFAVRHEDLRVDILHLSPPCQVWSRVHTRPGQNDDMNLASLFGITALIKKIQPRIVTLEQTFGIMDARFEQPFNSLVHAFTCFGYSVSWQSVKLQELGLPQSRQRLIMIAAGPGETLPDFVPMTHAENPPPHSGLKPFTTPLSVLQNIPHNATNHDIDRARGRANYRSWDPTKITKCITCGGGENSSYYDGTRGQTLREFARLQSFPDNHVFLGKDLRKQIGNAVPPMPFKILLKHLIKHLMKSDGVALVPAGQPVVDLT